MNATLSIGMVAQRTGVSVSTIRYYDELGIITTAARIGGKRRFADATVGRINFIRRSQDAGFTLHEIRSILDDTQGDWQRIVSEKIDELVSRRRQLDETLDLLEEIQTCGCEVVATCPARGGPW